MPKMSCFPSKRVLFLILFLITLIPFLVFSQSPVDDRTILLNVKQQWGDPPALDSWNTTSSPCNWTEITCSGEMVTELRLSDKNIVDKIPPMLCELKNLTYLNLSYNYIPGDFPTVLYNCSRLEYLDLSQNYFVGSIPEDIDRITTLRYLDIGANNFSGDIPPAIGRFPDLQGLHLYANLFEGSFPKEIGDLASLEDLGMAQNPFAPVSIPPEFGKLRNLRVLWMTNTNLIGEIPETFSNLSSLVHIDLSRNSLNGSIPQGLFQLKNLSFVYLYNNNLSGEIPTPIESLKMTEVDLSSNSFDGSIPEDFGKLQELEVFNLYENRFTGEVPKSIGLIPTLKDFRVFKNMLNGTIPEELGLHSNLEAFEISNNFFTGKLPENLCAGQALTILITFSNGLTGTIPKSLENCNTLHQIQVYSNKFSGDFPLGLWSLTNLSTLMIRDNSFSGQIPSKVAWNLSRVEINNNNFSGPIPSGISTWTNLVVFKASNNHLSDNFPSEITQLTQLNTLMLDGNSITGNLPSKIATWKSLTTLNLARNKLDGQIPAEIGSLPDLLNLDLSSNYLSGQIPSVLGNLKLTTLNLSSNELTGKIPDGFDNSAYETSFLNNPKLCAKSPLSKIPSCSSRAQHRKHLSPAVLTIIIVLAIVLSVITFLLAFFVIRDFRRKKTKRELAGWKLISFQKLDFTKASVLSSLTEDNLIGSGGSGKIYRVPINFSGDCVAVKRISINRKINRKLEKEFLSEVEILGTIRHSNIVKLFCCVVSEDSKLLVYEYMENNSLDRWLHGKTKIGGEISTSNPQKKMNGTRKESLEWHTRLDVAMGAARGLCYMHHDCTPPVIHRDIKSSNILLDSEFKAKIADFGLAKILTKQVEFKTMSVLVGSIGYMAPEYAYSTRLNEKIDVYSFGVVLLELVTGRGPNEGDENTNLAEWAWLQYGDGNSIDDALDHDVKDSSNLEEMRAVFKLGLICTSILPSSRPTMKDVVQILQRYVLIEGYEGKKGAYEHDVSPLLGDDMYLSSCKNSNRHSKRLSSDHECSFEYSV